MLFSLRQSVYKYTQVEYVGYLTNSYGTWVAT